jgi:hypothetical protein
MSRLLVFACGFAVGRSWKVLKNVVGPVVRDASLRFDLLYANTARSVAQAVEDAEDRSAERAVRIASKFLN